MNLILFSDIRNNNRDINFWNFINKSTIARREKRSSESKYQSDLVYQTLAGVREARGKTLGARHRRSHFLPHRVEELASMIAMHNRDYNIITQITIHIITLQK